MITRGYGSNTLQYASPCISSIHHRVQHIHHMSKSLFNVLPINPLTPFRPPYFEAVINTAKLTAKAKLSNLFLPPSFPSRIDADSGIGSTVAIARGATYRAISPRRFGDSSRIDQPQRRQPTRGPVVLSQKFLDLEGKRAGPRRERVRQTPYLLLRDFLGGRTRLVRRRWRERQLSGWMIERYTELHVLISLVATTTY